MVGLSIDIEKVEDSGKHCAFTFQNLQDMWAVKLHGSLNGKTHEEYISVQSIRKLQKLIQNGSVKDGFDVPTVKAMEQRGRMLDRSCFSCGNIVEESEITVNIGSICLHPKCTNNFFSDINNSLEDESFFEDMI